MKLSLFILALITLFISGGLFFKERNLKSKTIAVYFLLFALEILYFIYGTSKISELYPDFYGRFYFSIGVLYGPLLYFNFKSVIDHKQHFDLKDLWHFLPLLALNMYMFDLIIMSNNERVEYYTNISNFYNRILYLNYFRALHQVIYAFLLFRMFWLFKRRNINEKFYLGGISIIYVITTLVISLLIRYANSWRDFSLYYIISTILVFIIGYVLFKDPSFFKAFKEKYQSSCLEINEMQTIHLKIENEFSMNKIFLKNNLTLELLSSKLNVKPHHISQTLSEIVTENFNDYINRHRIEYSKILLLDPSYANYKIEAIAFDSGFNNKVTFYKSFSKFTNTTPSKFRKQEIKSKQ